MWACVITMAFTVSAMARENRQDAVDVVARIDDHGFAGLLVAENRAVALQHAHRQDLVDHIPIVYSGCGYHPMVYESFGGILVAERQKVVSGSDLPAHYSVWLGT